MQGRSLKWSLDAHYYNSPILVELQRKTATDKKKWEPFGSRLILS
ncbi:hypothetical protein VCRA2128O305_110106 [Vibrio crassostreae]|nr:hypothetical protein VCRA2113O218_100032 [Vibrio crassostreae]CAK1695108.1 hypothetical protein VCRA2118O236_100032 [Vibrio crassostreae]CAK1714638.1 hypothetical protein VCRA2113O213_110031 [Vibrio crassostreae]CAK1715008.1 hypothetical protein VCRA2113O197_110032 [Vibrio crassostreae]CAK1738519.1 hypothetical protein VCRA2112O188_120105 [Vibrio crassostreae]